MVAQHAAITALLNDSPPALSAPYYEGPQNETDCTLLAQPQGRKALRFELAVAASVIDEIAQMPANWDGYGATSIGPETVKNARGALNELHEVAPTPDITPNPNGTISFEWESPEGVAHLEIGRTKFSFYIKPRSGEPILADGNAEDITGRIGCWITAMLFPVPHAAPTITRISFEDSVLSA